MRKSRRRRSNKKSRSKKKLNYKMSLVSDHRRASKNASLNHLMTDLFNWYENTFPSPYYQISSYKLSKNFFRDVSLSPTVANLIKTFATCTLELNMGYFSVGSTWQSQHLIHSLLNSGSLDDFKQIYDLMNQNPNITIKMDVINNDEFGNLIDNSAFDLLKEIILSDTAIRRPKGEEAIIEYYKENIYDGEMPVFSREISLLERNRQMERAMIASQINRVSIFRDFRPNAPLQEVYNYDPDTLFYLTGLPSDLRRKVLETVVKGYSKLG